MRSRGAGAVALLLVALAAGCGGHSRQPGPAPNRAELHDLHPCPHLRSARCATLEVPLDHFGTTPGKLTLRVAIAGSRDAPHGTLVYLTGGPGQPGVPFMRRVRERMSAALRGYRLVMLDQRGTGGGALDCPALQRAMGYSDLAVPPVAAVRGCAARLGQRRRFFATRDTVADLDLLRAALGVRRWTLDGISYGTFVAERYALAHPANVNALVLDSVVPHGGFDAFQLDAFQIVPRVLRSACRSVHCTTDPARDLAAVVRTRHIGPALLDALVIVSVVDPDYRRVPAALHAARAGQPAALDRLIAGIRRGDRAPSSLLSQGLHASTLCEDFALPWGGPATPLAARRLAVRRAAARLTPSSVWPFDVATATGNGLVRTCENWPPMDLPVPPASLASKQLPPVPVLLLAGDRDLSTPLPWAEREARLAPRGRLVIVHGAGHGVGLRSAGGAGRQALTSFLQQRR
jgi:pimeloyl-ACP methyl ester carboxylesterase